LVTNRNFRAPIPAVGDQTAGRSAPGDRHQRGGL